MILTASLDVSKPDTLVKLAEDLGLFVRQAVAKGLNFDDVERGVFGQLLKIGLASINLFLAAQGDGDLGESVETQDGVVLYRSEELFKRSLRTIFGEHTLHSYVYSRGSKRKIELRPIDARINFPEGKASYLLQEFSQMFCVEKAFRVGARQFETVFGQPLSVDVPV